MKQRTRGTRALALLMACLIPIILFCCIFYIGTHEKHHCTGETCPICHRLVMAQSILHQFNEVASSFSTYLFMVFGIVYIGIFKVVFLKKRTLVLDKVRLDD